MTPIEKIKGRCRIDDLTDCWIWTGSTSSSNGGKTRQPRMHSVDYTADPTGGVKVVQTGNRAAWHAHTGTPIAPGHRVYKRNCINGLCVNPEHLACGTSTQWGAQVAQHGHWRDQPARIAANRATGRARSVVTPSMVRDIQSSAETGLALAARLGIGTSVVSRARRGQLKAVTQVGNFFSGLMK